ncbi:EF-hand domain containing 1.1 [Carabus blaptoides fortunei]
MTFRCPSLPLLPGYCFNPNIGQTRFHRSQYFEHLGSIRILSDRVRPDGTINSRYPSIYARGEVAELPAWIAFDKQVLTFDAFFQETLQETRNSPFLVRKCKLYFYLEDGTIKVVEPKVSNSGIPQGTLISRQRIRFPPPQDVQFYDIVDFNIGKEVELFGKVFKLTNCDQFTRNFLNRCGIPVPDPINTPVDPYIADREKMLAYVQPKKPNRHIDTFGQFLAHDRQVLRFSGYWDDRLTEGGILHNLEIYYFLADDTIEIKEVFNAHCGKNVGKMFIKRGRLPKFYCDLPTPGYNDPMTVLNVLGPSVEKGRFIIDPLNCGKSGVQFFKQQDLAIGAVINVYGRKVTLTDCDPYTKEFYRVKYGLDEFTSAEKPKDEEIAAVPLHKRKLPPWNGFGTFEDSAQNCVTVEPKQIMRDFKKFLTLDREGMDSRILRFKARMVSKSSENSRRKFIICYYLCDDTLSLHEISDKYSGSCFLKRGKIKLPGQRLFTSEPPDYYEPYHMFIGATLNINGFIFVLTDADEYALRYMELHPNEFPQANINIIMDKVREKLTPIYKDFVAEHLPKELPVISYEILRNKLCKIMGENWTEHEMITLARHFSAVCKTERHTRSFVRQVVLTELKRFLWDDMIRFKEAFRARDITKSGYLSRKEVYSLVRGCKLPLDVYIIENMLNVLAKNEECEIEGQDLFNFLDREYCPTVDTEPMNFKNEFWWASEPAPVAGRIIDWCAFNKGLDLEELFTKPIVVRDN